MKMFNENLMNKYPHSLETVVVLSNTFFFIPVYDVSGAVSDRNCVVLNDIHIDIMDYIVPASCNDTEFRQMWAEFEWENKVAVNTNISGLKDFQEHVIQCTNMKCLTPEKVRLSSQKLYH